MRRISEITKADDDDRQTVPHSWTYAIVNALQCHIGKADSRLPVGIDGV